MKVGKMKPTATLVAQFPAGVEIESIQHDGRMFLPVLTLGEFAAEDAPESAEEPETKPTKEGSAKGKVKMYTEKELMEMSTKDLTKILAKMGVDPDDFDGKNTNKKLRNLILDNQEEAEESEEQEEQEETPAKKPAKSKKSSKDEDDDEDEDDDKDEGDDDNEDDEDSPVAKVTSILEDFDSGKKNKKKTVAAIVDALGDVDSDKVASLVDDFTDDSDADTEEFAQKIVDTFNKKSKSAKKPAKKFKKDEDELVDVEDLKKGDRVSVYWDDDNKDWFDGTVASVKKGKVVIDYDDDTSEPIDPEVHTKIKRLAE